MAKYRLKTASKSIYLAVGGKLQEVPIGHTIERDLSDAEAARIEARGFYTLERVKPGPKPKE